jgi:DNA-directed RNA polymerase specialized sigma24 family protein
VPFFQVDTEAASPAPDFPETRELAPALIHALGGLPEPWRQTMRLFYLSDFRIADLAHRFDITLEGVRARLRKGRALLAAATSPSASDPRGSTSAMRSSRL